MTQARAERQEPRPVDQTSHVSSLQDELEAGSDMVFERRWWRFERVTWAVILFLVLAGAAGVFGRGPLTRTETVAPDGSLAVEHDRVARYRPPTVLDLRLPPPPARPAGPVRIHLGATLLQQLRINNVAPRPLTWSPDSAGGTLAFDVAPGLREARVSIGLQPAGIGPNPVEIALEGHPAARFRDLVLP